MLRGHTLLLSFADAKAGGGGGGLVVQRLPACQLHLPAYAGGARWQGRQHCSSAKAHKNRSCFLTCSGKCPDPTCHARYQTPCSATPALLTSAAPSTSARLVAAFETKTSCPAHLVLFTATAAQACIRCRTAPSSSHASCRVSCHQVLGESQQRLVAAMRADQAESDRQPVHPRNRQGDLRWSVEISDLTAHQRQLPRRDPVHAGDPGSPLAH